MAGTDTSTSFADVYLADPRLQTLVGPGAPFEIEEIEVDGTTVRSFVRGPRTILDMFAAGAAHRDLVHVVHEDERWTFGQVRARALAGAATLHARFGVERGDRVALAMRNYPEFVMGFWAAATLGAIAVPLNSMWTGPELAYALENCGAKAVFADADRIERLTHTEAVRSDLVVVAVRTPKDAPDLAAWRNAIGFDDLTSGDQLAEDEIAATRPDEAAVILYTSGTTGRPKGALLSNRNLTSSILNSNFMLARDMVLAARQAGPGAQPVSVVAAPMFHIGGVTSTIGGPMSGVRMVMMRKWDVDVALELTEREGGTTLGGVPAMARQVLDHPNLRDFDIDVRLFPMGGAAVPPELPRRALEIFGPQIVLLNGYGSTETTSGVCLNVGAEYAEHLDSVGRPNLTADLRIEAPDGTALPTGEIGELCFRSPQTLMTYWNDPQATADALVDGWFHTGDLGYVTEDGYVHVVDRLKDVVIRGGENVYCAEVEAVLSDHPGIVEVVVLGIPDEALGERVCAVVIPRPGYEVSLADLRAFAVQEHLAAFKAPEAVVVVDDIPRTATGKAEKKAIRTQLSERPDVIRRA